MAGANTYMFGECTWYVATELPWVRGGWGDAYQWAAAAGGEGFAETDIPTVGAVVVYAAGSGYSAFGHVAIVRAVYSLNSFLVSEMNYAAFDQVDDRVSTMYDVDRFILPPGVAPGSTGGGLGGGAGSGFGDASTAWGSFADFLNNEADYLIARANGVHNAMGAIAAS